MIRDDFGSRWSPSSFADTATRSSTAHCVEMHVDVGRRSTVADRALRRHVRSRSRSRRRQDHAAFRRSSGASPSSASPAVASPTTVAGNRCDRRHDSVRRHRARRRSDRRVRSSTNSAATRAGRRTRPTIGTITPHGTRSCRVSQRRRQRTSRVLSLQRAPAGPHREHADRRTHHVVRPSHLKPTVATLQV